MKLLCIARAYPPTKGGMEKYSFELIKNLGREFEVFKIVNPRGRKFIPIFFIWALVRSIYLIKKENIKLVLLTDCLLFPLGFLLKMFLRIKVVAVGHGLDISYNKFFYQKWMPFFVRQNDLVIANSQATAQEFKKRGIKNITVINCGIDAQEFLRQLQKYKDINILDYYPFLAHKKILLSVGHLVERKGFFWFAKEVVPHLSNDYVYVVIGGSGNNNRGLKLKKKIERNEYLKKRVFFLGKVEDKILFAFYNSPQVKAFIMPNIKVDNDIEGFGIVALEAGLAGIPVIASRMEGMLDSVIDGKTGILFKERDVKDFLASFNGLLTIKKDNINNLVKKNFDWSVILKKWKEIIINL